MTLKQAERQYLLDTLEACRWHMAHAAKQAGVSRGWLYQLMSRHSITRPAHARPYSYKRGNSVWQALA